MSSKRSFGLSKGVPVMKFAGAAVAVLWAAGGCTKEPAPASLSVPQAGVEPAKQSAPDKAAWAESYVEKMRQAVAAEPSLKAVNEHEGIYDEVSASVLVPWQAAWKSGKAGEFAKLMAQGGESATWGSAKQALKRDQDGLREYSLELGKTGDAKAEAEKYLRDVTAVDDFRLEVYKVQKTSAGAVLSVRYDLRGKLSSGQRRHDRGTFELTVVKADQGWKIQGIDNAQLQRVEATRAPAFQHATAAMGLDKVPVIDRREAIRRGGYALSVADYDGDKRPDMLVGNFGEVQLLKNTGKGFVDVTAEAGLAGDSLVKAAAFADLDNDGHRDLVLLRFVVDDKDTVGDFVAYRNLGNGKFERKEKVLPRSRQYDRSMPLTLADFNGDGLLDFYIGFPGTQDFTNNLEQAERKKGLASQGLWLNEGGFKFSESKDGSKLIAANEVYPHSAVASDFDQDGNVDLLVVDDSGRVNPVYKNENGVFKDVTQQKGLAAPGWSMGLAVADYDGDGHFDIVTSNVALLAGKRIADSAPRAKNSKTGEVLETVRERYVGAYLYRNKGDGSFEEVSKTAGLDWVGDAAGGAEWIDYNQDGYQDLYIPNGLWTAGPEALDSTFIRAVTGVWNESDVKESDIHGGSVFAPALDPNPMLTALRNYKPDANKRPGVSLGGNQRNRLYRNNGDGTFTEVGYLEAADRLEDGYVAASADVDGDGKQDLFLRNTDPAPGVTFESVTLLKNVYQGANTLTVQAEGTKSNRDGVGAIVTVEAGGMKLVREIHATTGATQSEPLAYFGLGTAKKADKVTVRWSSGKSETFRNVEAGGVVVREGKGEIAKR